MFFDCESVAEPFSVLMARNTLELDVVAVKIEACFAVNVISSETETVTYLVNNFAVFNELCGESVKIRAFNTVPEVNVCNLKESGIFVCCSAA